jgi:hypothetical protein
MIQEEPVDAGRRYKVPAWKCRSEDYRSAMVGTAIKEDDESPE